MTPERAAYERDREDDGWIRAWNEWTGPCGGPPIHHGTSLDAAIREAFRAGFSAGKARGREDERRDVVAWLGWHAENQGHYQGRVNMKARILFGFCSGLRSKLHHEHARDVEASERAARDMAHLRAPAEREGPTPDSPPFTPRGLEEFRERGYERRGPAETEGGEG